VTRRPLLRARRLLTVLALLLAALPAAPLGLAAAPADRPRLCFEESPLSSPPVIYVIEVVTVTETTLGLAGFYRGKQLQTFPLRGAARVRGDGGWDFGLEVFATTGRLAVQGRLFPPALGQGQAILYTPGGGGANPVVSLESTSCGLDFLDAS
jgi:hypothetical protein